MEHQILTEAAIFKERGKTIDLCFMKSKDYNERTIIFVFDRSFSPTPNTKIRRTPFNIFKGKTYQQTDKLTERELL
jgi:hypothetical protein